MPSNFPTATTEASGPTPGPYDWRRASSVLGWQWSPAHGGYINESHRDPGIGWDSYRVAADAEEACDWSGIETPEQAEVAIAKAEAV